MANSSLKVKIQAGRKWFAKGAHVSTQAVLDMVYPPHCVACEEDSITANDGVHLCTACRSKLLLISGPSCHRCGAPTHEHASPAGGCPQCQGRKLHFDRTLAMGRYEGQLRELILCTKNATGEHTSATLAKLACTHFSESLAALKPQIVTCVPSHWRRRVARGTNGPEVLARLLAKSLGIPLQDRLLRKKRNTSLQHHIPRNERFKNVQHAFGLRRSLFGGKAIRGKHVMLVDDILTTGATCSEIARILKTAGAVEVSVLVLGRTLRN